MANDIKKIVIRRLESDNQYHVYYPQTLVDGLQDNEATREHFANADIHVTADQRANVLNKGLVLDDKGLVPDTLMGTKGVGLRDYANFAALKAAADVKVGEMVMVLDAQDNDDVAARHEGWEIVKVTGTPEAKTYEFITKAQLMDYVVHPDHINGMYTSSKADIDAMVANDHTHDNLAVLNTLTEEKMNALAKKGQTGTIKYGENVDTLDNKEGDMVYKVTGVIAGE